MNELDLTPVESRAAGALIGTFVGDALGMPVEGLSARQIESRHGKLDEMLEARRGAGTYTDDTQMMVALTKSMLRTGGINRDDLAESFLDHYEPDRGYGRGTRRVMDLWERGVDPAEASEQIFDGGSYGNGASMRTAPLGIVYGHRPEALDQVIDDAAGVTHAHPRGRAGAYLQSRAIGEAFSLGLSNHEIEPREFAQTVLSSLPDRLTESDYWSNRYEKITDLLGREFPLEPARVANTLGCSSVAGESVPTAQYAFLANWRHPERACVYAVGIGGDTDTIGAMAGSLVGAYHGLEAFPERWLGALENGPDGRDDIIDLGRELIKQFEPSAE